MKHNPPSPLSLLFFPFFKDPRLQRRNLLLRSRSPTIHLLEPDLLDKGAPIVAAVGQAVDGVDVAAGGARVCEEDCSYVLASRSPKQNPQLHPPKRSL